MTLHDWITESRRRFEEQPPATAARRSARAFARGGIRRVGRHVGGPIWEYGDWDVLVVLDACRTDLMREVIREYDALPDVVETRWSNASCSIDWILRNWTAGHDAVPRAGYVTANPFADHDWPDCRSADLSDHPVGYLAKLYETHWMELRDGIATVPPEAVTNHTVAAWRAREDLDVDRLVAHYMQPHEPYITRPEWGDGDHRLLENLVDPEKEAGASVWPRLQDGEVDRAEFWAAYKDNLRWVLDDVTERLLPNVEGRVALTADHGNAMGEWGEWHHPPGAIGPAVRRVPYVPVDCVDEGTLTPTVDLFAGGDGSVDTESQLSALGYV
ncbi:hypothetical protein [Halobaculum lipolyticum]|uniref:Uncharacterized protein n=1 Tax=Halobaculum lipolyticum TaxID=3032001 RepID=A0ABD5WFW1_9EURY|nr:hypothetical protein [Halobaculum sp. DT31]